MSRVQGKERPRGPNRARRTRLMRLVAIPVAFALTFPLGSGVASAYWSAGSVAGGNGRSVASAFAPSPTPIAKSAGTTVTVSWPVATLTSGQAVSGYIVKRYDVATVTAQPMLSACNVTVAAKSCIESNVPLGAWTYSVTPVFATNWRGAESAQSSQVTVVNQAPSFTKGANKSVRRNSGAQTAAGWATAISQGTGEAGQLVDFIVTNDDNPIFSVQPAVSATGTLTFTPAANATGAANVSVSIHDNGGTANGVTDTSAVQSFTITITAAPGPVTALTAAVTATSIALAWTNPTDADFTGVMIRRAVGATVPLTATDGDPVTDTAAAAKSYLDTGLAARTQYSYAAFAHDVFGNHAAAASLTATTTGTAPDVTAPGPVSALSTTAVGKTITLAWTNPTDADFTGVTIRRLKGAKAPTLRTGIVVTDTTAAATSYTNTGLTSGRQYSYAVFAHDGVPNHSVVATKTAVAAPGALRSLGACAVSNNVIALNWSNPSTASRTGTMIRRAVGAIAPATATDGALVVDAAKADYGYIDTSLTASTQYSYAAFAHDGVPSYSLAATVTRTTTALASTGPVPNMATAAVTTSSITLAWTIPTALGFTGVTICSAPGATPPPLPFSGFGTISGTMVTCTDITSTSYIHAGLTFVVTYSSAVFAHDNLLNKAVAANVTATTDPGRQECERCPARCYPTETDADTQRRRTGHVHIRHVR